MNPKVVMAPERFVSDSARDRSAHPRGPRSLFFRVSSCPGARRVLTRGDLRAVMTSDTVPVEQRGTLVDELRIRDRAVETVMWNESAPGEKLLTKGEVAQLCRVEIRTVDRWVAAGKIRCYRIPSGRLLFRKRDVLLAADRREGRVV